MHLTQSDFILTITSVVLSVALLATFFFVVLYRYYRASTRHHEALLKAMAETEEHERQRIAEDMHDGLGQLLSGVKMQVGALERYDNPELYSEVADLKRSLDEGMLELRRIVRNLVPRRIERDGLVPALADMCEYLDKNVAGVRICLHSEGTARRLGPQTETNVYRIAQELVNNAIKHAHATCIRVHLFLGVQTGRLTVEDNGVGYEPSNRHDGHGLQNLRNRVQLLRGQLAVETNEPAGTRTVVSFKLPKASNE